MGVDNDSVLLLGVEYDYAEICGILEHPEMKALAKEIGTDSINNLWQEYGYITANEYFDCSDEETRYFIGILMKNVCTVSELKGYISRESEVIAEIHSFSSKFGTPDHSGELSIISVVNIT